MFTCISASKKKTAERREGDGSNDDTPRPNTKTLAAQIKEIALKVSNTLHIKPHTGSTSHVSEGGSIETKEEDQLSSHEWMVEVAEGVHITFVSLPQGGNELRKLRFNRDMFSPGQAQKWWEENRDKIAELYNIQIINKEDLNITPTPTPTPTPTEHA